MSAPEGFFARWHRRKRAAREADAEPDPGVPAEPGPLRPEPDQQDPLPAAADGKLATASAPSTPTIDLASLPPIETITAATDIRAFLAPGVPEELKRAALRRAWSVDPAIRDFVGIAENQWDFTASNEALGFGPLPSGEDVRRLVAEVLGDRPESPTSAPGASAEICDKNASREDAEPATPERIEADASPKDLVHRSEDNNAPLCTEPDSGTSELAGRRGHGSAVPR